MWHPPFACFYLRYPVLLLLPVRKHTTRQHSKLEAAAAVTKLRGFIGRRQLAAIGELSHSEERTFFINKLVELGELVTTMPTTYQTEGQGDKAVVHLHYFTSGADWYIVERDSEDEQLQALGKADFGYGAELGYISIVELLECGAELDLHWRTRQLAEI